MYFLFQSGFRLLYFFRNQRIKVEYYAKLRSDLIGAVTNIVNFLGLPLTSDKGKYIEE